MKTTRIRKTTKTKRLTKTQKKLPKIRKISSKIEAKAPSVNNDLVTVKKSNIDGLGVFALVDIPEGTKIADYYGKEMKWKTFKNRYGDYKTNSLHTYPMRRIWKILVAKEEPYKTENITNYINEIHGKANCELKLRALYAKRDIKKGDELLLDYPKDYNRFWLDKSKTKKILGGSKKTNCENKCKEYFLDEVKKSNKYKRYEYMLSFFGVKKNDMENATKNVLDSDEIKKNPVFKDCERTCMKNK